MSKIVNACTLKIRGGATEISTERRQVKGH